jgi:hypothetical protein
MHSGSTEDLLSNTSSLIDKIFWFNQEITCPAAASHKGIAINYVDIKEMRDGFIKELQSTASNWVYSKEKYRKLLDEELRKRGHDIQNATSYLTQVVDAKFRKGCPQGQFGELLLFNLIQYFFKASPLLRKMSITTNPGLERHGADAIHYRKQDEQDIFILGESKCYESRYKFNAALSASVSSILETFNNIENELILYQHDDFIQPELQGIAKCLKDNKLANPRIELVCIVAYDENKNIEGHTSNVIKDNIVKCVKERWENVPDNLYDGVSKPVIQRIHYIIFPVWSLSQLLERF